MANRDGDNDGGNDKLRITVTLLLTLLFAVVLLSALTVAELWALNYMGYDVIARLQASAEQGESKFYFEAFGAIAFVIGQPVFLFGVVVWGLRKLMKDFHGVGS